MRITVEINGYYEWEPCPPGTQITKADVEALRVKKMADDKWHMRVPMKCDHNKLKQHFDIGPQEPQICHRMAALEKLGRFPSREGVVQEMVVSSLGHHIAPGQIDNVIVHDDGPNEELMKLTMLELAVPEDQQQALLDNYMDGSEQGVEDYLNVVLKTKKGKKK